jgi:hypothetical protein
MVSNNEEGQMRYRVLLATVLLLACGMVAENPQDQIVRLASDWLSKISTGDKAGLNAMMDAQFIATTPGGDLLSKDRLVPNDERPVQTLPLMKMEAPMVRISGNTAVLMTRLSAGSGPNMNATFVFINQGGPWKLFALQLSPQK